MTNVVKYPQREDVQELVGLFHYWLNGNTVEDSHAFRLLVDRLRHNKVIYGDLPDAIEGLDTAMKYRNENYEHLEEELAKLRVAESSLHDSLEAHLASIQSQKAALKELPSTDDIKRYKRECAKEVKRLRKENKKDVAYLSYVVCKAASKHGKDSTEYQMAKMRYRELKDIIDKPLELYYAQYKPIKAEVEQREFALIAQTKEAYRIRDELGIVKSNKSKLKHHKYEHDYDGPIKNAWRIAVSELAKAMRWDEKVLYKTDRAGNVQYDFRDASSINRSTFISDLTERVEQSYDSNMFLTQGEHSLETAQRNRQREEVAKKVAPYTIDLRKEAYLSNFIHQQHVEDLVKMAEFAVSQFSEIPLFQLQTEIDFRATRYGRVSQFHMLPRVGYFQFRLVAPHAYKEFESYLTKFQPLSNGQRRDMIESLIELGTKLTEYAQRIKSINGITMVSIYGDQVTRSVMAISTEQMQDVICAAIAQLKSEEPDIDNYTRTYIENNKMPGYIGGDINDLRCMFYNPFSIAPVYYFFGVAGAAHQAVDKVHYWLHIANGACEEMDCIPSALSIRYPAIVNVPEVEIAAVRELIQQLSAKGLANGIESYRAILAPITASWIIVRSITQSGTWTIEASSDSSLNSLTPIEFSKRRSSVIGLHVKGGHITRIVGIEHYDGAGWQYRCHEFVVIANVDRNTGAGSELLKLLRGNSELRNNGLCCIGQSAYELLLDSQRKEPAFNVLAALDKPDILAALVHDVLEESEVSGRPLGPGTIDSEYYDNVPITKLTEARCMAMVANEYKQRASCAVTEARFEVWAMLRLPQWIIVSQLDKDKETWTVEEASHPSLLTIVPSQAVTMAGYLIVLMRRGGNTRCLSRVLDYYIKIDNEFGSQDQYTARYNMVMLCDKHGILDTIRANMPRDPDGSSLISFEELAAAELEDTIEKQLKHFHNIRYIVLTDLNLTKGGRIKSYEEAAISGTIKPRELIDGAPDLLRLWLDPNRQVWLIVDTRWYSICKRVKELYEGLPTVYIGADYETVNRGSDTLAVLLSWARLDSTNSEISTGYYKGTQCTKQFVDMLAKIVTTEHRRIIVITFHGAFFDMHMMLEGIATWGDFGRLKTDRITVVGNKILQIDWFKAVKFIDLRRFTMNSLAGICEAFHVKNPKSAIDLKAVQSLYDSCNCNIESFWIELSKASSAVLTQNIDDDAKWPEFQRKIANMNAEQAYIEYCVNDSVATVQCYMKVKQACSDSVAAMDITAEMQKPFMKKYNIDRYCTIPSMAYSCYRTGLPVVDKKKLIPPIAASLPVHRDLKASGVGGRSEVYSFAAPHMIQEHHQVFDVVSLFPFCAMAGHMPAGDLHKVYREDNELPIKDKLGVYWCTIITQPEYIVIPIKRLGESLNWKYREVFDRWVHVVLIRLHIYLGGTIQVHYGYYWDSMNDHYFDYSLRLWKSTKIRQDVLKGMLATVSDEDPSVDMEKFEALLAKQDKKVEWAFTDKQRDQQKIDKVLNEYNPMVRWMMKMSSNSLLGRTAKKLKEYEIQILNGSSALTKFIEDHHNSNFLIHQLSKNVEANPSVMMQLVAPYSKCAMAQVDVDQTTLFETTGKRPGSIKVPEVCISVTMYAYTHFHMAIAMQRFFKAKAVRGIETDGIHANPTEYVEWCERTGISNPFWIDSPLCDIAKGSILDDAVFKPTPGDERSAIEMKLIGAFYCPTAANRYAVAHNLPAVPRVADYGYFTEELRNEGLYDVFYPFCKFYYYKCLDTGVETIKAKGLSASKKSPSRDATAYLQLEHSTSYELLSPIDKMRALQSCFDQSPPAVNRALFIRIGEGVGVDMLDYRFQGRLSKINAIRIDVNASFDKASATPIHYTLCTKRVEPHHAYRVECNNAGYHRNGVHIEDNLLEVLIQHVVAKIRKRDYIALRGFHITVDNSNYYLSHSIIKQLFNKYKQLN